jgi:4-hydroxy 2-oxovalerate aldolase
MHILDCTLRDGGYYTNWDFDNSLVNIYIEAINRLPIDYIEVGYRNLPQEEYMGEFGYCPASTLQKIRTQCSKKIAVMLNEKSIRVKDLQQLISPIVGLVDMVRLAVDPKNLDRALGLASAIKDKYNIEVAFNVMYMSTWDEVFYDKIHLLNGKIDLFCMVDSYGSINPQEVKSITTRIKRALQCKIGFHGHNNLQLSLINTLTALDCGADFVDCTICGMGRGAGNLNTELLLTYCNKYSNLDVNFNVLGDMVATLEPLQQQYQWGTSLPYMLSGANSIPQKDVMEWVQNRIYSFNSIVRALDNRKSHKDDNAKYPILKVKNKYQNVLIIGGGETITRHITAIKTFVEKSDVALVFATARFAGLFENIETPKYYCLLGNESKRLSANVDTKSQFNGICVMPPYPRKMGTDVPKHVQDQTFELPQISFISKYLDSCTTLAVELAHMLKADNGNLYVVGYDGYQGHVLTEKELTLNRENEEIFDSYTAWSGRKIISLLPTLYKTLDVKSLYNLL